MIRYKCDVVAALRDAGYTSYRIIREGPIHQSALQKLRHGQLIAWEQLNRVCNVLHCQPGDLLEHVPDDGQNK